MYIFAITINYKNMNSKPTYIITKLIPIILASISVTCFNDSICNMFWYEGVYFTINTDYTDNNRQSNNMIYNYCHELEYYCQVSHRVVNGSLIKIYPNVGCYAYKQENITLLDANNLTKGVAVNYELVDKNANASIDKNVKLVFECQGSGAGCPDV